MSNIKESICDAIKNKQRIQFEYNNKIRVGEPQCCGLTKADHDAVRVYLIAGGSRAEQLFTLSKFKNFKLLNDFFVKPGPNYKQDDSAMKIIYCQL